MLLGSWMVSRKSPGGGGWWSCCLSHQLGWRGVRSGLWGLGCWPGRAVILDGGTDLQLRHAGQVVINRQMEWASGARSPPSEAEGVLVWLQQVDGHSTRRQVDRTTHSAVVRTSHGLVHVIQTQQSSQPQKGKDHRTFESHRISISLQESDVQLFGIQFVLECVYQSVIEGPTATDEQRLLQAYGLRVVLRGVKQNGLAHLVGNVLHRCTEQVTGRASLKQTNTRFRTPWKPMWVCQRKTISAEILYIYKYLYILYDI